MLEFRGVCKHYAASRALNGVSLQITGACTTVLIGPSGCGKSTLLRLVVGLIRPDAGEILLDGRPLADADMLRVRQRIGYVIQEGGLFPHLTAADNVTLMAQYLGWDAHRCRQRIAELAELVHLEAALLDRYPSELSGGQRQRVSIMRALMLDPDLLLLDEPLGALDPMIRFELQKDLRSIFSNLGKTVLLVTHDMGEAGYLGDTLVLMREGRIVQTGTPRELVHAPADPFVEQFITAQRAPFDALSGESG